MLEKPVDVVLKGAKIVVPLKYLRNFQQSLEMSLLTVKSILN